MPHVVCLVAKVALGTLAKSDVERVDGCEEREEACDKVCGEPCRTQLLQSAFGAAERRAGEVAGVTEEPDAGER